jgi:hypothetical protein
MIRSAAQPTLEERKIVEERKTAAKPMSDRRDAQSTAGRSEVRAA